MSVIRFSSVQRSLMLAATLSFLVLPTAVRAYTADEQQACSDDAFRFCSAEIPDVDRVTVCMVRNKSRLSPGCQVYFRPDPEVAPAAAGGPLSLRPGKHVGTGPHKSKKTEKKPEKKPEKKHHAK